MPAFALLWSVLQAGPASPADETRSTERECRMPQRETPRELSAQRSAPALGISRAGEHPANVAVSARLHRPASAAALVRGPAPRAASSDASPAVPQSARQPRHDRTERASHQRETQRLNARGGELHDDRSRTFRGAFSEHYDESRVLRSECVLLHVRLDPLNANTCAFSCRS